MKKYWPFVILLLALLVAVTAIYSFVRVVQLQAALTNLDSALLSTSTSSPGIFPYINTCIEVGYCPTTVTLLQRVQELQQLQSATSTHQ